MKNKTVKMVLAVVVLGVCCGAYAGVKTYVAHQEQKESEEDSEESTTVFTASMTSIMPISDAFLIVSLSIILIYLHRIQVLLNDLLLSLPFSYFPVYPLTVTSIGTCVRSVSSFMFAVATISSVLILSNTDRCAVTVTLISCVLSTI